MSELHSHERKTSCASQDTITALATPSGRGGISVIRTSGPQVKQIAGKLFGRLPKPRQATYVSLNDASGHTIDMGLLLYFPAPHSFTGEDVIEFQGHGSPVVCDAIIERILQLGARMARPGEFSERAFLNNKLDLIQAEAIADLIDAGSAQAARAAMRSLQGVFSQAIQQLVEALIHLRCYIEAALDFSDEEIDFLETAHLQNKIQTLSIQIAQIQDLAQQGVLLKEGLTLVIAGQPNAGKSSLLNLLSGRDSAIVTPIPGTTRDVLKEHIHIDGIPFHLIDTAGLRHSDDPIEQEGIRRAWNEIKQADRVLLIIDSQIVNLQQQDSYLEEFCRQFPVNLPVTVIRNKIDLSKEEPTEIAQTHGITIGLSAKTQNGVELLRQHLKACAGINSQFQGNFSARRRHLASLEIAQQHIQTSLQRLAKPELELIAEELRLAQQALGEITGEFTSDDLLGRIFASFCIGK